MLGKYEGVVAAAMKGESALWEIGDEIIAAIGNRRDDLKGSANDGSRKELEKIANELKAHGIYQYKVGTLAKIRLAAGVFKEEDRVKGVSFSSHIAAGTPEILRAAIKRAGQENRTVSPDFVIDFKRESHKEDKEARKEARKDALDAKKEAERDAAEAREEKRQANSKEAKEAATRREQEAKKRAKEAELLAELLKGPPAVNHSVPKKGPAETPMLVVRTTFSSDLFKARALVEKMAKDIEPHLDDLPDSFVNASVEDLLELSNAFRQLSNMIRSGKVNKRSHLHAVGE